MIIVHRCPDCGFNDLQHTQMERTYNRSVCRLTREHLAEHTSPEVIPTWRATSLDLVTEIHRPGSRFIGIIDDTCDCDQCQALYAEQAS